MENTDRKVLIMPCLDMQGGRVVKGVQFVDIRDAGDPAECCVAYCKSGDEVWVRGFHRRRVSGRLIRSGNPAREHQEFCGK